MTFGIVYHGRNALQSQNGYGDGQNYKYVRKYINYIPELTMYLRTTTRPSSSFCTNL